MMKYEEDVVACFR